MSEDPRFERRRLMRVRNSKGRIAIVAVVALVLCLSSGSAIQRIESLKQTWMKSSGTARLVSIEQIPQAGETCLPEEAGSGADPGFAANDLFAAFKAQTVYAAQSADGNRAVEINRPALRTIQDTDSIYTAVAVDTRSNE